MVYVIDTLNALDVQRIVLHNARVSNSTLFDTFLPNSSCRLAGHTERAASLLCGFLEGASNLRLSPAHGGYDVLALSLLVDLVVPYFGQLTFADNGLNFSVFVCIKYSDSRVDGICDSPWVSPGEYRREAGLRS